MRPLQKAVWKTHARRPNDVFRMLRRPSAASPTVPVGALRALWNVTESAITGEPLVYSTIRDAPSAPLAMRWPTVAVKYRYRGLSFADKTASQIRRFRASARSDHVRGASSGYAGSNEKNRSAAFDPAYCGLMTQSRCRLPAPRIWKKMGLFCGPCLMQWSDVDCSATRSSFDLGIGLRPSPCSFLQLCPVTHLR